jgi:hypothetical protein
MVEEDVTDVAIEESAELGAGALLKAWSEAGTEMATSNNTKAINIERVSLLSILNLQVTEKALHLDGQFTLLEAHKERGRCGGLTPQVLL